jgi:hypothetical protein
VETGVGVMVGLLVTLAVHVAVLNGVGVIESVGLLVGV